MYRNFVLNALHLSTEYTQIKCKFKSTSTLINTIRLELITFVFKNIRIALAGVSQW